MVVACAKALVPIEDGPDATIDASVLDASACDACPQGQICSSGTCKLSCDLPTVKCTSDAGPICTNIKTDPTHCGACATSCKATADAGSLPPGAGNPVDGGVPFDSGIGWSLGSAMCDAGGCGVVCDPGLTACTDGICYDTQNFHDRCGDCTTACAADTEWCNAGHCCALGTAFCGGMCTDVLTNNANCGGCGVACSANTPNCYNGVCSKTCVPSGTRQAFNTISVNGNTANGCWAGNPCAQGTYVGQPANGRNFKAVNQEVVCGGTTACVKNVGITTYQTSSICQGQFDVYCDATKVGTIDTTGKACIGDSMTNGCKISFAPISCTTLKFIAVKGTGAICCGTGAPDQMLTGVSAW